LFYAAKVQKKSQSSKFYGKKNEKKVGGLNFFIYLCSDLLTLINGNMKKLWLASIIILACCVQAEAQKYLNIYQDGLVIKKILASEVDSISVTNRAPYTINMWYQGKAFQTFASEEVDSIKVINENGGPLSYLGIIGFNSDLHPHNIGLLSNSTVSKYKNFINNLPKKDGTILYYAVDSALYVLDKADIKTPLSSINFVTFTDGLDQGSIMKNPNYTSSNSYLDAISRHIKDTKYKGLKIDAYSIGLRGNDVTDVDQFKRNLTSLASSDQNAFEVSSIRDLRTRLQEIANKIINVNYRQTISVRIPGADHGTLVRFTFDGNDADHSQLYIQGTLDMSDYSLRNVTYQGIKARSGSVVQGTKDDIFLTFTFRGLRQADGETVLPTRYIKQYNYSPSSTAWQINSEFVPDNNTQRIVSYSGTLIVLVLDCSSSLGYDFSKMQSYANEFVDMVSQNAMPFTFESPRNVVSGMDDKEFAVNVSWDAVKGAEFYQIYRSSNGNSNSYQLIADNVKSCTWKDYSPLSGNNYYKVCAVGLGMTTEMSSGTNAVNYSLDVPRNVKAELVANGEKLAVNIQWDAVKFAEAYQVYRSTSSYSNFELIADSVKATSYKDKSELSGKYYYRVRTIGHGTVSPEMNISAEVNYSLETPQNVKSTQNSDNLSINVTWDAVNFAQSYTIYRSNSYYGDYTEIAKDVKETSWTDKSPKKGDNYYKVSAVGYGLTSQMSNRSNSINSSLSAPYNVQATLDDTKFKVTVTWDAVTHAEYYQVYRSPGINTSDYELVADNITSCSWTDPSPKVNYNGSYVYYRVYAVSGGITSSASSSRSIYCSIDVPNNNKAELCVNNNKLAVNVKWDAVNYAEAYQVYRSNSNYRYATYVLIADSVKSTSYVDISPIENNNYYRVRAIGHGMVSSESNTTGINYAMPVPSNITGKVVLKGNSLANNVTWDAVNIAESYTVYRCGNSYGEYKKVAENVTDNSWTDNEPMLGDNYYKVQATGYELTSELSTAYAYVICSLSTPTNVKGNLDANSNTLAISITWDTVKYAEYYQVYRSPGINTSDYELVADKITSCSWKDESPKISSNGSYIYYKVYAVLGNIISSSSNSAYVYCSIEAPKNNKAELCVNGNKLAINVKWDAVNFAEKYQVYRSNSSSYYANYELIADDVTTNSWTDNSPLSGYNYYKIVAIGYGLTSSQSDASEGVNFSMAAPAKVAGELALNSNKLVVNVTWDVVENAESYNIYRSSNSYDFDTTKPVAENVTGNSWTDAEPIVGSNYYKVQAKGYGLTSQLSSSYAYVDCSLSTPSNVKGEVVVNGTTLAISITWDIVKFAESYNIYRSNKSNNFDYNNPVAKNITSNSWIDNNPLEGYNYYRVEANGHGLNSGKSDYIQIYRSISTPSNVQSELVINDKKLEINITWDAVSIAESYKVYRTNDNKLIAENITSNSCIDDSPLEGSNRYQVYAVGYGLTSSGSYTSSINYALDTPSNFKGEMILSDGKQVTSLSWNAVNFAESYNIYRSNSYSGTYEQIASGITSTSWKDETPLDGYNYYKVSASGYGLNSGQSSYIRVTKN
jgi:fibronectin type 3 domain-containing protein